MERKAVKTKWIPMNLWSSDADQCITYRMSPSWCVFPAIDKVSIGLEMPLFCYESLWNFRLHLFIFRNLNIGEKEMERKAVKTKWIPMNLWSSDADQCVTCALGPKVILLLLWPSWSPTEKKEAAKCVSKKTVNFPGESKSTHSACSVVSGPHCC